MIVSLLAHELWPIHGAPIDIAQYLISAPQLFQFPFRVVNIYILQSWRY